MLTSDYYTKRVMLLMRRHYLGSRRFIEEHQGHPCCQLALNLEEIYFWTVLEPRNNK